MDADATLVQDQTEVARAAELSRQLEAAPARVPGYTLVRSLGDGAYGSVWLAFEENTGKQVAIKFYTHHRGLDWSLLNREVEKLAVLYTSRNIVRLIDVGWNSEPPYYVMEYLAHGSLASFLTAGPLPPQEAVRIAKSVLLALVHAHGSGILHCDLKPANVLLDNDFEPRLCDFGQSRLSNEQNPALGTVFYMAPEQADLHAVPDARWDVYALGALLYHMLCGEPPYRTPELEEAIRSAPTLETKLAVYRQRIRSSPKPLGLRSRPGIDRRLAEIVERCLHVDPEKRYPNAQAVLDTLVLRDRSRARRPLITLGIVGPSAAVDGDGLARRATARHDGDRRQRPNDCGGRSRATSSRPASSRRASTAIWMTASASCRISPSGSSRKSGLEPVQGRHRQAGRHGRGGQPRSFQAAQHAQRPGGRALEEFGAAGGL